MKMPGLPRAAALLLCAAAATLYPKPVMAQARPALVQDVDQAARAPFTVTVPININNFNYTNVAIPAGKRLVIDYVTMSGAAQTTGAYLQPIIIFSSSVAGNPNVLNYFAPNVSTSAPGQYYANFPTTLYADSLAVGPAFAGYTPSFLSFNVVITGHLITP
jgi:hypothetical protein